MEHATKQNNYTNMYCNTSVDASNLFEAREVVGVSPEVWIERTKLPGISLKITHIGFVYHAIRLTAANNAWLDVPVQLVDEISHVMEHEPAGKVNAGLYTPVIGVCTLPEGPLTFMVHVDAFSASPDCLVYLTQTPSHPALSAICIDFDILAAMHDLWHGAEKVLFE